MSSFKFQAQNSSLMLMHNHLLEKTWVLFNVYIKPTLEVYLVAHLLIQAIPMCML
jgi:hypothetical protein